MNEQEYSEYIKQVTPTHNTPMNVIKAFLVGGVICTIGQALTNWFVSMEMCIRDRCWAPEGSACAAARM